MHVHARAVVLKDRFGHERDGLVVALGHLFDDVLVLQQVIPHRQQGIEPHVDLGLPGRANLVVLDLDVHANLLEGEQHFGADVL